jgi:GTP-binding protein
VIKYLFASLRLGPGLQGDTEMEIKQATYLISSPSFDQAPKPDRPEIAFIGRSNVGKSSLINMLCNNRKLAKISSTPGKTQLINHFEIISTNPPAQRGGRKELRWYLVDLPGYGFAKQSQSTRRRWEQMIENYLRKRENLVNVFVLVDSRHGPQQADIDFMNNLGKWQIPFSIVFTKADKNKDSVTDRNVKAFLQELSKSWEVLPTHFISSALTKQGRKEILDFINELNSH